MTYTMNLNNARFAELTHDEMVCVDGGVSWNDVGITVSGAAGGYIGAKIGGSIGTAACPGVGTVVGGIIGAAAGVILYTLFD